MEYKELKEYVEAGLSTYKIAKKLNKGQSTIRYWLNKHNLKTESNSLLKNKTERVCPKCSTTKTFEEFYTKRNTAGASGYCKICTNLNTVERQRKFKINCVKYKGGECVYCTYNKCLSALEFHHLESNEKEFTISQLRLTKFEDKVKKELDKCILVCANCHREIHEGIIVVPKGFEPPIV